MPATAGRPLGEIETWIFDLDNTLYPVSCRRFDQIHARMTRFIADRLDLTPEAAMIVQKTYFREHGTTLRGLMTVNRIDPDDSIVEPNHTEYPDENNSPFHPGISCYPWLRPRFLPFLLLPFRLFYGQDRIKMGRVEIDDQIITAARDFHDVRRFLAQ